MSEDLRPKIPADISRHVLFEAGHRCSVCGDPCPLERAHIIPWKSSHDHSVGNLICLCANCHQRADSEKWGESVLQLYKQNPWVMRCKGGDLPVGDSRAKLKLHIEMQLNDFDEGYQHLLTFGLASFLKIAIDQVKIVKIEEGSVIVTLELPEEHIERAQRLLDSVSSEDLLSPFAEHIANCQECSARLERSRRFLILLRTRLTRLNAPEELKNRIRDRLTKPSGTGGGGGYIA